MQEEDSACITMNSPSTNKSQTLYTVLTPLNTLWQVCGLAPVGRKLQCIKMRLVFRDNKLITPSLFWLFVSLLTISYNTYNNAEMYLRIRELVPLTYLAVEMVGRLTLFLTYGTCVMSNMSGLIGFNECLKFADERLPKCEASKLKVLGTLIVSVYTSLLVTLGVNYFQRLGWQLLLLTALVHTALVLMVALQQVMLVLELWVRFRSLNTDLLEAPGIPRDRRLRLLLGGSRPPRPPPVPPATSLRQLREAHVALTRAADLLQRHFGLPAACSIATSVCGAICAVYELVMAQVKPAWIVRFPPYQSASVSAIWLTYHLIKLASLTLSSAVAADAASATGVILLRASAVSASCSPDHEAFLRLTLMGPPLRFTAAGFLTIDRQLLLSGIALIITYVVILGQLTITQ